MPHTEITRAHILAAIATLVLWSIGVASLTQASDAWETILEDAGCGMTPAYIRGANILAARLLGPGYVWLHDDEIIAVSADGTRAISLYGDFPSVEPISGDIEASYRAHLSYKAA